jgi:hypothetical protein
MKVYKVKHKTLQSGTVCWKDLIHAIEELNMHLVEGSPGDVIEISIGEMLEEEYENLPEFKGY